MKKNLVILAMIILVALAFSFCSKSSGPSPDFKYLGTWIGQNSFADSVEIRVANVSNKQKVTYIKLIVAIRGDSMSYTFSSTSGLTEIADTTFSYTAVEPGIGDTTWITVDGTFQSETLLNGGFDILITDEPPITGTYTATKQ